MECTPLLLRFTTLRAPLTDASRFFERSLTDACDTRTSPWWEKHIP